VIDHAAMQCDGCGKHVHRGVCAAPIEPLYPIRNTAGWRREIVFARHELLKAWDNNEPIGPWVQRLINLLEMR